MHAQSTRGREVGERTRWAEITMARLSVRACLRGRGGRARPQQRPQSSPVASSSPPSRRPSFGVTPRERPSQAPSSPATDSRVPKISVVPVHSRRVISNLSTD